MTRSAGNRFRTRKLSTKQTLAILRENQIDSVDDDGQRNIPQIETGVERQEEIEHHLQAAISAHQAAAVGSKDSKKVFIPTPNTTELSAEHYGKIYPKRFHQPFSYIRSSATVEDCCGTSYCMSAEDDKYLAKLNSTRKSTLSPITEDEFETIMDLYESTIQQTQPYLSMDVMNIIPFEELEHAFEENLDANLRAVAKSVYSYWKEQKISRGGRSIIPCLKFEQGNEKDEGDPYVCFRRREVRQVRKTRRTDAQSTEKLKKIRQEFETARGLVKDVLQREQMRRTSFVFEKQIFEQRRTAVELKRKLNIKDTDEDLVNKPKRTRTEPAAPPALRIPLRQDGKPPDADLRQLSTARAEDEKRRLEKYNQLRKLRPLSKYPMVDLTQDALFRQTNPTTTPPVSNFCSVQTFYLPSPPHTAESTVSSPGSGSISLRQGQVSIIQASPKKMPSRNLPTFRRRLGRGGRVLIDRRGHASVSTDNVDPMVIDRIKFDNNNDELDLVFPVDPYSDRQVKFRAQMLSPPPEHPLVQTPTIRRQVMASSPVMMTPGTGNSSANLHQRGMTNGHHPVPPHNPTMAHNAMQVNGHSTASFPTRR
ncbi:enhancer of polycomb-like-domain-containing protein [Trichophaea hybrida]|nr:enhancer of polycomb-like-domain-containing protein [Trichophaea hybrida]